MLTLRAAALAFLAAALAILAAHLSGHLPVRLLAHGFLAVGALPLMMAAILHFVPVLTRSGSPPAAARLAPWLGAAAGASVWMALAIGGPLAAPLAVGAALLNLGVAVGLALWIGQRRRRTLGAPHPGLDWYLAALLALALAMVAATLMWFDAPQAARWKRLHLHLNLFGWVLLTVLGTAPVLLPTVVGRFDPTTAARLRRLLPWAAGGSLALAGGAALPSTPLAAAGALSLLCVMTAHALAWWRAHGAALAARGAALALTLALAGLALTLTLGAVHGLGRIDGARLLAAFLVGGLLPLISGALTHLLPVWRFPGPASPARQALAARLQVLARTRAVVLALAGGAQYVGAGPAAAGVVLALLALLHFAWLAVMPGRAARV